MARTLIYIGVCALLVFFGVKVHFFHTDGKFSDMVHVFLTLIPLILYFKSGWLLITLFNKAQLTLSQFTLSGWFSVFGAGYVSAGPYVLRLSLSVTLMMIMLNTWHLFTFGHETAPNIKNISWRVAHVLLSAMMVFIAKDYRNRIENHDVS